MSALKGRFALHRVTALFPGWENLASLLFFNFFFLHPGYESVLIAWSNYGFACLAIFIILLLLYLFIFMHLFLYHHNRTAKKQNQSKNKKTEKSLISERRIE